MYRIYTLHDHPFLQLFLTYVTGSDELGETTRVATQLLPLSATAQMTFSTVKFCLSLQKVDHFHALWNKALLHSNLQVFYASK